MGRSCGAWSGAAGGWWRAAGVVGCAEFGAVWGLWAGDQRRLGSVGYAEPESDDGAAGWTCHELVECIGRAPSEAPVGPVVAEGPLGQAGSGLAETRQESELCAELPAERAAESADTGRESVFCVKPLVADARSGVEVSAG